MERKTFSDILNPGRQALQYLQQTASNAKNSFEYAVTKKFTKNNSNLVANSTE